MHICLPVTGIPVNALLMLMLGGPAGFVSGMSGVGGGYLMTPVLMFAGVPGAAAATTGSLLGVEIVSLLRQAGQLRCGSACPAG